MEYRVHAVLRCGYTDPKAAGKLLRTVSPDNGEYLRSGLYGGEILSEATGDSILGMRSTLDDFLACLGTAEQVILKGR